MVGALIKQHYIYPIGHGCRRYANFYAYSHAAAGLGYVILTGNSWIQSTGILEKTQVDDANLLAILESDQENGKYIST